MVNANNFYGADDSEILANAIKNRDKDGIVIIPPRSKETEPERDWWLLDRAVLLPENTTVILQNCKIKLSDRCRDNFFRTANCGIGIEFPEKTSNIHIKGEGYCLFEGADHPRAVGDSSKILANPCPYEIDDLCRMADWIPEDRKKSKQLNFEDTHIHSYGTDAGNPDESQHGDWRGIGILFANAENVSIENLCIKDSHGWAISFEACSFGRIEKIRFDACMSKEIDGMRHNMENQDGIDLRNGCHDIIISDITGRTGDDVVALTAIAKDKYRPGGSLKSTHVMHSDWTKREKDIYNIIIRNIAAYSNLCYTVRLLPVNTQIRNVVIDGVIDTSPDTVNNTGGILLGALDFNYGENLRDGMKNITVSNVICNSKEAVTVEGYVCDSVISNVVSRNPKNPAIVIKRENGLINTETSGLVVAMPIAH